MVKENVDLLELLLRQADGADLDERSGTRLTRRNGYRPRRWDTRVDTIELGIPKLRDGSYFPSLLKPVVQARSYALRSGLERLPRPGRASGVLQQARDRQHGVAHPGVPLYCREVPEAK